MTSRIGAPDDRAMLLKHFTGEATEVVDADPSAVFAAVTDITNLPVWNRRIASVVLPASGPLAEGVEWKVQMSVPPAKWVSHARVLRYDPVQMRFDHRSDSDDGNPSFAVWSWTVTPEDGGARIHVAWDINPETFWRQLLFGKLRRRQLAEEVPASLRALCAHIAALSRSRTASAISQARVATLA